MDFLSEWEIKEKVYEEEYKLILFECSMRNSTTVECRFCLRVGDTGDGLEGMRNSEQVNCDSYVLGLPELEGLALHDVLHVGGSGAGILCHVTLDPLFAKFLLQTKNPHLSLETA